MSWNVRINAPTPVSLGRVISHEPGGFGERYDYVTFLQGDDVPQVYIDPVLDRMKASPPTDVASRLGGDHLWVYLESDDPETDLAENQSPVVNNGPAVPAQPPASSTSSVWDDQRWTIPSLQSEAAKRNLTVQGTGANGNIKREDYVNALKAYDAANNPQQ